MNNKAISKKREKQLAKDTGGKAHARSGGLWFKKSDASDPCFQYEDKFTKKSYYSINIDILNKIESEAKHVNKLPVLRFGFTESGRDYVVLRIQDVFPVEPRPPLKKGPSFINIIGKSKRFEDDELYSICVDRTFAVVLNYEHFDKTYIILDYRDFLGVKTLFSDEHGFLVDKDV